MKKVTSLVLFVALAAVSQAQVTPTGNFATFPFWTENFDSFAQGNYNTLGIFSGWGGVARIGTGGQLAIAPIPSPSAPNVIYGYGVDMRVGSLVPMKRFGGWFKSAPIGVFCSAVRFRFLDASGTQIGQVQSVPLNFNWQWIGFQTTPLWSRVEIYGNVTGFPGAVAMDSIKMRVW